MAEREPVGVLGAGWVGLDTAVGLAEQGRTMLGGIPRPLDLALFTQEFEDEVQGAFPPRWLQRSVLAPLAWLARRRGQPRAEQPRRISVA